MENFKSVFLILVNQILKAYEWNQIIANIIYLGSVS